MRDVTTIENISSRVQRWYFEQILTWKYFLLWLLTSVRTQNSEESYTVSTPAVISSSSDTTFSILYSTPLVIRLNIRFQPTWTIWFLQSYTAVWFQDSLLKSLSISKYWVMEEFHFLLTFMNLRDWTWHRNSWIFSFWKSQFPT